LSLSSSLCLEHSLQRPSVWTDNVSGSAQGFAHCLVAHHQHFPSSLPRTASHHLPSSLPGPDQNLLWAELPRRSTATISRTNSIPPADSTPCIHKDGYLSISLPPPSATYIALSCTVPVAVVSAVSTLLPHSVSAHLTQLHHNLSTSLAQVPHIAPSNCKAADSASGSLAPHWPAKKGASTAITSGPSPHFTGIRGLQAASAHQILTLGPGSNSNSNSAPPPALKLVLLSGRPSTHHSTVVSSSPSTGKIPDSLGLHRPFGSNQSNPTLHHAAQ
jgi:hypothetical protein